MSQSNDEYEECFIPANWEQSTPESTKQPDFPTINMKKLLSQAKQLHNINKPTTLMARTCFLQLPMTRLPQALEESTTEQQQQFNQTRQFKPLENYSHLTFQEYFRDYQIIYNKMKMYGRPSFELLQPTSRFKPITYLADFNQKLFKQLNVIDNKNSPTHVFINDSFDSNFQCGNLGMVYKKQDTMNRQYFLLLENDINTHGYASWFFFKVKSCGKGRACFHILNFSKSLYLYRMGWKISIFSTLKNQLNQVEWFKGGKNIQVYNSGFQKRGKDGGSYYCLYFQYDFQQNQSQVYFAMSKPYTYSMLANSIEIMRKVPQNDQSIKIQTINSIYSISCNIIPIIILTQNKKQEQIEQNQQYEQIQNVKFAKNKKSIVFMARQHPGQIVGSNLMEETMKLLVTQKVQVKQLLKLYTIILIPMVNPDGVIHGNSRCNLAGLDLNRQWMKQNIKEVTPETYYLRKFLWEIQQKIGIEYLIDLHGHSKKMNSFFFCNKMSDKFPSEYLPYLVSKIDKRFELGSCTFNTTIDKKNTLRNQLYQFGMKNCITVQNSYFGYFQQKSTRLYKSTDFKQMAESIIKALHFMLTQQPLQLNNFSTLYAFSKQQIANQIKNNKDLTLKRLGKSTNQDIQSESDPEGDIMKPQQMLKIYQYADYLPRKKSEIVIKKKVKTKKTKQQKQRKQTIVTQPIKDDEIRKSEPSRGFKQKPIEVKNHKSQKKLELSIENKKSKTQQRFRDPTPKPALILSRKQSQKRERVIKKTVLNVNHPEKQFLLKQPNQQEDIQTTSSKNIVSSSSFYKYPSHQGNLHKISDQQRKIQARIKTQVQEQANLKKNTMIRNQNYEKLREERLKMFLNQTLSIMRVNNHEMVIKTNESAQFPGHKGSLKNQKVGSKKIGSQRFLTQTPIQNYPVQIINSHQQILGKQRRKFLSRSYRKQLLKRKKILSVQQEVKQNHKYKKFQNFRQNQEKEQKKQVNNLFCSSVFYYFPVI